MKTRHITMISITKALFSIISLVHYFPQGPAMCGNIAINIDRDWYHVVDVYICLGYWGYVSDNFTH